MSQFNSILSFLSKLAIICNGCFIFSLLVMFVPVFSIAAAWTNFIAVLGLEMAPIVSFLFGLICLFFWVQKRTFQIPNWQIILNLCMLFFQLIFIIV